MKEQGYADVICRGFCRYYNPSKEEIHCGTYQFLRNSLTAREIQSLLDVSGEIPSPTAIDFSRDEEIRMLVCERCDFVIDGCDFRENRSGPPCGGYAIIERLLK